MGNVYRAGLVITNDGGEVGPENLIAHRGVAGSSQAYLNIPENSLRAWNWAVNNGADILDLDVHPTQDGKFVVMHDDTINRTTNKTGWIKNHSLSYITSAILELPEDENHNGDPDNTKDHPPSLDQALAFLSKQPNQVTLELKGDATIWTPARVNALRTVLRNHGMLSDKVIVHGFYRSVLRYARAAGIPARGYCVSKAGAIPTVNQVKEIGQYVCISYSRATKDLVTQYRTAGLKVIIWTMDSTPEYEKAWSLGPVYGWMVNDLLEAQRYLKGKK